MFELDNFLNESDVDAIYNKLSSTSFPWYYFKNTVYVDPKALERVKANDKYELNCFGFRHFFITDTQISSGLYLNIVQPFLDRIQTLSNQKIVVFNLQSNLVTENKSLYGVPALPHIDVRYSEEHHKFFDSFTGILYLNDCGGDTVIYDKLVEQEDYCYDINEVCRITPKKNKFIFFDSKTLHSSPVAGSAARFLLNINFYLPKNQLNSF